MAASMTARYTLAAVAEPGTGCSAPGVVKASPPASMFASTATLPPLVAMPVTMPEPAALLKVVLQVQRYERAYVS